MKHLKLIVFICFIVLWTICCSQTIHEPNCSTKESCGACIRELGCVWCNIDNSISASQSIHFRRCISEKESIKNPQMCKYMINPKKNFTIITNIPLTPKHTAGNGNAVQISPQKVKLTLRKGEEHILHFNYAQAEDYPVDLYYIMDLSQSMLAHKNKLSTLGTNLAIKMKSLTKNFRLGFGSFVDKTTLPYTSTVPAKLKNPCSNVTCAPPYSFKNHLSLTEDTDSFATQVKSAQLSGNLDHPEGALDALMQAIVCQEEIGWRKRARRLLVLSSDAQYHIAGDGKLGGVVVPHDGKCYMNNHTYTHGLIYDYPSIGHINSKAIEHNINIIFAVVKNMETTYRLLKECIKDSAIGTLSDDSSNVISLITGVYDQLVDSVEISDNSDSNIEVKYFSPCTGNISEETNKCDNLRVSVQVNFTAVIKVLDCPKNGSRTQTFQIKPGALNESLTVELELLCDCDCEKPGHKDYKIKAKECSNQGTLKCGVCDCVDGKLGSNCECDGKNITAVKDTNNCKPDESSELCSGLGTCQCNKCVCNHRNDESERIYGKYCECNNYSCKRHRNKVCSGETRGNCECGECSCLAGYAGEACECPDNNNTCILPTNKEVCSGRGECKCGQCECKVVDGYIYSGKYCDECPSCPGSRCKEFRHCVECVSYKTGIYNESACAEYCTKYNIELVEKIDEDNLEPNEKFCRYPDENGCNFVYKYSYDVLQILSIFAQKEKICSKPLDILAVVLMVIGSILLGGIIILLIWKGVTTVHDRREYAKFETERKNANWNGGDNPLFKNPTSTFKNPMFSDDN